MRNIRPYTRFFAIGVIALGMILDLGMGTAMAQARAHVYLFRGLGDVFSLGMDTLADELNRRGVYATSHSHTDWKAVADKAVIAYKARTEGPIILIGHSLGADAVMEMADYLGDKGVPVALLVPFDGTQSFPVPGNVAHVLNFTQRDYAYMRPGPGFHGSLNNVDLSFDHDIDHLNIDKSPPLHARVISEVLAVVGGRGIAVSAPTKPTSKGPPAPAGVSGREIDVPARQGSAKIDEAPAAPDLRARPGVGAMRTIDPAKLLPNGETHSVELPENGALPTNLADPTPSLPAPQHVRPPPQADPSQIAD